MIYEDIDIAKGIVDYVNEHNIEVLVLGAAMKAGIFRYILERVTLIRL